MNAQESNLLVLCACTLLILHWADLGICRGERISYKFSFRKMLCRDVELGGKCARLPDGSTIKKNLVTLCLSQKCKVTCSTKYVEFIRLIASHITAVTKIVIRISWWCHRNLNKRLLVVHGTVRRHYFYISIPN